MNINTFIRKNIKLMKPYSSARDEFIKIDNSMVFLDANENPFETGLNRYPDPQQTDLKRAIARQKGVLTENILLGNGSDEVLDLIFRVFCEPAIDNIITLPPTYGMYGVLAEINDIENRKIVLDEHFQPNVDRILAIADAKSKLLFVCSPNNPTGNSFTIKNIEKLLNSFNGLVVLDEAYIDFSSNISWLKRLNEFPNLIITHTLSKAYGLAGIRLGICYSGKEIIATLNKIKPPYNINELTQNTALKRIQNTKLLDIQLSSILEQKAILLKALLNISFVKEIYPTDANFVLVKVDDAIKRYEQLIKKGIVVRNRNSQPLCKNCLRITIGLKEENEKLIRTLKSI